MASSAPIPAFSLQLAADRVYDVLDAVFQRKYFLYLAVT